MNNKAEDPNLWNDATEAQKLMRERQQLDDGINGLRALEQQLRDNIELIELGEEEGDAAIVKDAEEALKTLRTEANRRQVEAMLSGEADSNDSYLEVHSGAGGTESPDWAMNEPTMPAAKKPRFQKAWARLMMRRPMACSTRSASILMMISMQPMVRPTGMSSRKNTSGPWAHMARA